MFLVPVVLLLSGTMLMQRQRGSSVVAVLCRKIIVVSMLLCKETAEVQCSRQAVNKGQCCYHYLAVMLFRETEG